MYHPSENSYSPELIADVVSRLPGLIVADKLLDTGIDSQVYWLEKENMVCKLYHQILPFSLLDLADYSTYTNMVARHIASDPDYSITIGGETFPVVVNPILHTGYNEKHQRLFALSPFVPGDNLENDLRFDPKDVFKGLAEFSRQLNFVLDSYPNQPASLSSMNCKVVEIDGQKKVMITDVRSAVAPILSKTQRIQLWNYGSY